MRKILVLIFILCFSLSWAEELKPPLGTRINFSYPLAKNLVGCWLAQEGSGNKAIDISGNNYHSTFGGTAAWTPSRMGWAYRCNSSGNNVGPTLYDGTAGAKCLSIEAWVLPYVISGVRYLVDNSPLSTGFGLRNNGGAVDFFTFHGGVVTLSTSAGAFVAYSKITHVVGTHGSAFNRIYVDGILKDTDACTLDIDDSTDTMEIGGACEAGSYGWSGEIVLVRVWERELTQREVTELYNNPYGMFKKPNFWTTAIAAARRMILIQ